MSSSFPTIEEIIAIHNILIEQTGGAPGLREMGPLESAALRPQVGYYSDVFEEAAALMESLAVNHAFVDGNKRIAFAIADTFLRMNGYCIDCDNRASYEFFIGLFETGSFNFENLRNWLVDNAGPTVS